MTDEIEISNALNLLFDLRLSIEKGGNGSQVEIQNSSAEIFLSLTEKNIMLFPTKLEKALIAKLDEIAKSLRKRKPKGRRKDIALALLAIVNKQLNRQVPFIHFSESKVENGVSVEDYFGILVSKYGNYTIEDTKAIWSRWSKEIIKEPLHNFLKTLQELLYKLLEPQYSFESSSAEINPFELSPDPDSEDRVKSLYNALKKEGYIEGGSVKAFVDIFKGEKINRKIKFNFNFKRKCHTYYFLVALAEKRSSIFFPRNQEYRKSRRHTIIPWKFLSIYFNNAGDPLDGIKTHGKGKMPEYLNHLIKIV